ncbi:MAG TPA: hypothetical protein VMM38_06480 [Aridibacter sp.]|nr:hypothetical protein [Aridibacter sp.]
MNQDYLWNRTGTDAEIEDLERKLAPFRLKAKEAPRIMPASEAPSRRRFGFRLAFAGLSFASVLVAAFTLLIGGDVLTDPASLSVSLENGPSKIVPVEIPEAPSFSSTSEVREAAVRTKPVERRATPQIDSKPVLPSAEPPSEDQMAKLTKEEREAYDQLLLALSVTTSSLKLVQDKADGNHLADDAPADAEIPERSN